MAKARTSHKSYISKVDKAKKKIEEKPERVLNIIGQFLASEMKRKAKKRSGRLKRSFQYWARKREKDLQVGSKSFYVHAFEFGNSKQSADPIILPTVMENVNTITSMVKTVYSELNNDE